MTSGNVDHIFRRTIFNVDQACNTYTFGDADWFWGPEDTLPTVEYDNRYFWMRNRVAHASFSHPYGYTSFEKWYCADSYTGSWMEIQLMERLHC